MDAIINDKRYIELSDLLTGSDRQYHIEQIEQAYLYARDAHEGQKRKSGDPYIDHPVCVAMILVELGMDNESICAALLHDVVEDTDITIDELRREFGQEITSLVDGLTKLKQVPLSTKEQQQAENIRKMLFAMSQDIRVIIIKLADRLHNMRTLGATPEEQQLRVSLETMEIYAPIAHRLGISAVKEDLEDLALRFLDPVAVDEIEATLALKQYDRNTLVDSIVERIKERLISYHIEPHIQGRVKSLYGIYRKMYMTGREFDEVYDIFAVRIIVNTDIECYNILGIIHDMFRPIPNRFKDYISTPKPNMYQSLHTTVIGQEGIPFEIQIRTWEMHTIAEYGVAAHWKYKEGVNGKDKLEDRLAWVRRIIESQQDSEEDIVRTIKTDLTPEEVYAFTPRGDVKCLPSGSTVIDFAYAIHSEVGNKMIGAKVDGRIVSREHVIKNGQIVEIMTTKSVTHGPNKEWLNIAKTSEARSKIRAWFKKERREENIIEGKLELERELKRNYIHLTDEYYDNLIQKLCKRYNHDVNDLYAAIGYGGINLAKIMPNIKEDYIKMVKAESEENKQLEIADLLAPKPKLNGDVIVEGLDNCMVKFAKCCAPLPGDDIIGFVTRGHGVSVHKRDCVNVVTSMNDVEQKDRWIEVNWTGDLKEKSYSCTLDIIARDRDALFADVGLALANMRIPVTEISARKLKNGNAIINATINLQGVEHLRTTMKKLDKVSGVISVERSGK